MFGTFMKKEICNYRGNFDYHSKQQVIEHIQPEDHEANTKVIAIHKLQLLILDILHVKKSERQYVSFLFSMK